MRDGIYYFNDGGVLIYGQATGTGMYVNPNLDFMVQMDQRQAEDEILNNEDKITEFKAADDIMEAVAKAGGDTSMLASFQKGFTNDDLLKKKHASRVAKFN